MKSILDHFIPLIGKRVKCSEIQVGWIIRFHHSPTQYKVVLDCTDTYVVVTGNCFYHTHKDSCEVTVCGHGVITDAEVMKAAERAKAWGYA